MMNDTEMMRGSPQPGNHEQISQAFLSAAIRGFVHASDRDLLRSEKTNVIKCHECSTCGMKFAIARVLETHQMIEHGTLAHWRCEECGMQFIHGGTYSLHMSRSHLVKPGYRCPHCPAQFPHRSKLSYHMRKHTGEQPFTCNLCPRTFRTSGARSSHVKIVHFRLRTHLCDLCGKKFFGADELNNHKRTHTGEKPYSCPVCLREFSKSVNMHVHLRQHTGEKPYVCDQCGQSFTVRVSLRTHLKSKHNIIVDTSMYRHAEDLSDSSIPAIGRPKRKDAAKQGVAEVAMDLKE